MVELQVTPEFPGVELDVPERSVTSDSESVMLKPPLLAAGLQGSAFRIGPSRKRGTRLSP